MSAFNRRVWRSKPPMGTPLVNGLFAPDRIAIPFNEISLNPGFRDYAVAPSAPVLGVDSSASNSAIVQGRNGPMLSITNTATLVTFTAGCARLPTTQATFVIGYNKRDATARAAVAFGNNTAGGAGRANTYIPFSDGVVYWDWDGTGGSNRLSIAGLSFGGYDIWAFTTGPRGMEIWRNGQLIASNANNATRSQVATNDFFLGSDGSNGSDLVDWDFLYCYSTQIPPAHIQKLSVLPFSVFEPHRTRVFAPRAAIAHPYTGSGGVTFEGAAIATHTAAHAYIGAGGLTFEGAGLYTHTAAHAYVPSGLVTFEGAGKTAKAAAHPYLAAGGLAFAGAAVTFPGHTFAYVASDGILFGGASLTGAQVSSLRRGNTAARVTRGGSAAVRVT